MKRVSWLKWSVPLALVGMLTMTGAQAADDAKAPSYGPGYGPGMMGGYGYGRGMMGGYGRGYGQGMMYDDDGYGWGGGYGRGMMGGGWGRGYGMMGGGYGMGMMGGGYGMGMMGLGPIWSLNLSDNQRRAVDNILNEQHKLHWSMMSALFTDYGKLSDLYSAEHWDADAIDKVYADIFKNQRAMIESSVKIRNRIYDQLTKEQKEQLRRYQWGEGWGR